MLNPESLNVSSFVTGEPASSQSLPTTGSGPDCIVYVSDCVSCFPDPATGVE
ncbi:MAG TPA: hypothetical protein VF665_09100 [Longimicrobium sp.]|jgi:hypothetical protein|uniref:hypothetical protein n=1 Tax=Longimicrobium sp. TaxID=2029185 RepID=UPI002ED9C926